MEKLKVIIRVDDIDENSLFQVSDFFKSKHPDVPVSAFLLYTHTKNWSEKGWKELKDLIKHYNWEAGGHSRSHPYLSLLEEKQLKFEVQGNILDIHRELGKVGLNYKVSSFAYPFGDYNEDVIRMLQKSEVDFGLTFPDGFPYESAWKFPKGKEKLELGLTITDRTPRIIWDVYFKEALAEAELYILCLHTKYWSSSVKELIEVYKRSKSPKSLLKDVWMNVFNRSEFSINKWEDLDKHLTMIKKNGSKVKFTTFRELLTECL